MEFIENSSSGVILFTLGSTMSVSTLPVHILKALIRAFSRFPQRVLLKFEGEMKDKPDNVMIKKWFPQRDILSVLVNMTILNTRHISYSSFCFSAFECQAFH